MTIDISSTHIGNASDAGRIQRPKKAKRPKTEKPAGRDEMLSEYLASLGKIPLLEAHEELELAAELEEAEVESWRLALSVPAVVVYLEGAEVLDSKRFRAGAAFEKLCRAAARRAPGEAWTGRSYGRVRKEIEAVAKALRVADDDRQVIEEALEIVRGALEAARDDEVEALRPLYDELRKQRRRGLRIRNKFVRANLRLVVSVARRFHHYRLPLIDLIQEGNLGLIKSVHRFDHKRGFRFSTYAHWWIRQAVERAIMNKGAQVRLPVHIFDARREVAKVSHDLRQCLRRDPSQEELAVAMGLPLEKLLDILKAVPREPMSLDDPIGDDEDRTLAETIASESESTDDEVIRVDEARVVKRLLDRLSPMEVDIIERRFGLKGDQDETLEEIGKSYNLSRERVRQIQVQGLKKMQKACIKRFGLAS